MPLINPIFKLCPSGIHLITCTFMEQKLLASELKTIKLHIYRIL
jgi:hypothetical protein